MRLDNSSAQINLQPDLSRSQKEAIVVCSREFEACQKENQELADPGPKWRDLSLAALAGLIAGLLLKGH